MHNIINKTKGIFALSSIAVAMINVTSVHATSAMAINEADLPTKYIVKFKPQTPAPFSMSRSLVSPVKTSEAVLDQVKARNVEKLDNQSLYSVEVDSEKLSTLRASSQVEYVEIDPPRYLLSETTPWGFNAVNAQVLSDANAGNRTVCIIDSGYDISHNDLSGNRVSGTNDSGTGSWSAPGNNNAHGTHVAGTIAAIANSQGVKGVMPNQNVNLHIVKVFNESGWGYSSSLVKAIQTCADNGANVVNMSLGGSQSSRTEQNALQSLYDQGVLLIAAAGNDGNTAHSYPASYDAVMSVAAVDNNNQHAAFSQATSQVDIAAPGVAVLSTVTVGEGILSDITVNGASSFERGVVPHNRKVLELGDYISAPIAGAVSAPIATCDISSGSYNCGDMANKICLTERLENQATGFRPEINAVKACYNAGAKAAIVYSNQSLQGLQSPFVLDDNDRYRMVSVSIDRDFGLELADKAGQTVTVSTTKGKDYQYYNGTSMATPHVTGVAGLVWSYHPNCSAQQIRKALVATATDIDVAGRDNRTGHGMINAEAAKSYLDAGCNGNVNPVLDNGVAKTSLFGDSKSSMIYTFDVPAEATQASFTLSGGNGDADLYVRLNGEPSESINDCHSETSTNNESCTVNVTSSGTYQVLVFGFTAYSGASLVATHNGANSGEMSTTYTSIEKVAIPDNQPTGAISELAVIRSGDAGMVNVTLNINHTYIGDLLVTLTSPSGENFVLHGNTGGTEDNINETYQADFTGVESKGTWTLSAVDSGFRDSGSLTGWALAFK
ncbi:S8 family serine peptidase [Vibrio ostreicida]|uniref:S8 family serine peptidase n=1 Tax=Vibrio ostreicida TaxID=526588 RepID=UPI003B592261